MESIV